MPGGYSFQFQHGVMIVRIRRGRRRHVCWGMVSWFVSSRHSVCVCLSLCIDDDNDEGNEESGGWLVRSWLPRMDKSRMTMDDSFGARHTSSQWRIVCNGWYERGLGSFVSLSWWSCGGLPLWLLLSWSSLLCIQSVWVYRSREGGTIALIDCGTMSNHHALIDCGTMSNHHEILVGDRIRYKRDSNVGLNGRCVKW